MHKSPAFLKYAQSDQIDLFPVHAIFMVVGGLARISKYQITQQEGEQEEHEACTNLKSPPPSRRGLK